MPSDRRWSDADRELVAETLHGIIMPTGEKDWPPAPDEVPAYAAEIRRWAAAVLDALTADGWRPAREYLSAAAEAIDRARADERAQVAEEIAELRQSDRPEGATWDRGWYDALTAAATSVRTHPTTPEEDQDG